MSTFINRIRLGTLGGQNGVALAASTDGSVIVGNSSISGYVGRAFRWTEATGMVPLNPDNTEGSSA